jgi:peptidoglycan/LPS O-acetylase OafA/YrhL
MSHEPATNSHSYRPDIDGLRAIAVLSVLAFHAFPARLPGGFAGVDVFFVISGFLIGRIILQALEQDRFSFVDFYERRIRRIFPALIVLIAAALTFGWFALLSDEYDRLGRHAVGNGAFFANVIFYREAGYFDDAELKPLLHLWSLSIEEQFYLLWPLLLYSVRRSRIGALVLPLGMVAASFAWNLHGIGHDVPATFFLLPTRLWEMAAGTVLAQLFMRPWFASGLAPWSDALSISGLALVSVAFFALSPATAYPGAWALLPVGGAVLLIAAGPGAWVNRLVLTRPLMVGIGLISYPLYLWHWPLLSFAQIIQSEHLGRIVRVVLLAAAFALAWATYRFIEHPIRHRKGHAWPVSLVALGAVLTAAGYLVSASHGWPSREREARVVAPNATVTFDPAGQRSCRSHFPFAELCVTSAADAGQSSMILLGDSHAGALYGGLARGLRGQQGLLLLGGEGVAPLLDFASMSSRTLPSLHKQMDSTDRILQYAASAPQVRTVILAFRSALYESGRGFHDEGADRQVYWKGQRSETGSAFRGALRETLELLAGSGKRVVFVVDVPELGFDPRSCLDYRPLSFLRHLRSPCAVPRAEVDARTAAYKDALSAIRREIPQVEVFDPTPLLCDATSCWALRNGRLLYRDDDHLSDVGADLIGGELARALQARGSATPEMESVFLTSPPQTALRASGVAP